jgi:hypothetical protein
VLHSFQVIADGRISPRVAPAVLPGRFQNKPIQSAPIDHSQFCVLQEAGEWVIKAGTPTYLIFGFQRPVQRMADLLVIRNDQDAWAHRHCFAQVAWCALATRTRSVMKISIFDGVLVLTRSHARLTLLILHLYRTVSVRPATQQLPVRMSDLLPHHRTIALAARSWCSNG